jgi:DNA-binding GntR family transcriptional regulator
VAEFRHRSMIWSRAMTSEDETAEFSDPRVAELRRAVLAGEYSPGAELIAGAVIDKLGVIRRARRRLEALGRPRSEPQARPPRRRFAPRSQAARSPR